MQQKHATVGQAVAVVVVVAVVVDVFVSVDVMVAVDVEVAVPLAIGVGRWIVLLGFTLVLILGAALCAVAKTYEWHLAARMILRLCAGQSEAQVPMIT